ncbi:hypothetical protein DFJ63DRAFT_164111 [Scheffersomyces coipomensis]|uniref:uncharacterized protein n=1 Tax=Scheffersomyces coipomensis TaxID=1788519 RepID=UPI00315D408C
MVSSVDLKALNIFLNTPINHDMIHKIVVATLQVLPCKDSKTAKYQSKSDDDDVTKNGDGVEKPLPSLMTFLTRLVRYTNVYTGTLMATLVYLNRLKSKLPKNAQGLSCTRHRILLSCLILSSKFHNDSSPKNKHWSKYTDGLFNSNDINLMERQLLYLLNWDLKISNEEMCQALNSFLEPIKFDLIKSNKMRKFLSNQRKQVEEKLAYAEAAAAATVNTTYSPPSSSSLENSPTSSSSSSTSHTSPNQYTYSRSSSTSSISSNNTHYRQASTSSISSMASTTSSIMDNASMYSTSSAASSTSATSPVKRGSTSSGIDPIIELTALKEELELNRLLRKLNPNAGISSSNNQCFQKSQPQQQQAVPLTYNY